MVTALANARGLEWQTDQAYHDRFGRLPLDVAATHVRHLLTDAPSPGVHAHHDGPAQDPPPRFVSTGAVVSDCDFDTVLAANLTVLEFQRRFLSLDRPVRIVDALSEWPARERFVLPGPALFPCMLLA